MQNAHVWVEGETLEFFDVMRKLSLHLKAFSLDGELDAKAAVKESLTTVADGKFYLTQLYNLDAILVTGSRPHVRHARCFEEFLER